MGRAKHFIKSGTGIVAAKLLHNTTLQTTLFNAARLNRAEFNRLWAEDDIRFLSYVFAKRGKSRSQILQDLWVCFELDDKRGGYFVEFGATNGLTNSNTWLLEKEYGWSGILAEPNPYWHEALAANRQAIIEHRCVAPRSGERVAFTVTDNSDPELSGIAKYSAGDHFADQRKQGGTIELETISLNDLLDRHSAPEEIDYLSMDTEGSEFDIISNFDFSRRRFKLVSVEINATTERSIEDILGQHGYVRVFPQFSQWDAWFVSSELSARGKPEIFAPQA